MPIYVPPITRRDFLAGTLAAGAALALPRSLVAEGAKADPNRFVLLADTHVCHERDRVHSGVKPVENFAAARKEILELSPRPAAVVVCGDCVFLEGLPGDYATLAQEVRPIREAGIPLWLVLGNHDHRDNFYAAFPDARPKGDPPVPDKHVAAVPSPHADWLLLDSLQKTNYTPGRLGEAQLKWLAGRLDAAPKRPALVVAHHNPDYASKTSGLEDTKALFEALEPRKQAKAYFYGHTHAWGQTKTGGIHVVNVPTLVWVFDKKQPRAWVDVQLGLDGMTLALHALDKSHPAHGEKVQLAWRT